MTVQLLLARRTFLGLLTGGLGVAVGAVLLCDTVLFGSTDERRWGLALGPCGLWGLAPVDPTLAPVLIRGEGGVFGLDSADPEARHAPWVDEII